MKPYALILTVLLSVAVCLGSCSLSGTDDPPFWDEIQNFIEADKKNPPPAGCTLFVGSSSIRKWTNLEEVFKPYDAVNRGFGGATLEDVYRYADHIILPYEPRQILMYCGDNDIATDTVNAKMVFDRFKRVFEKVRQSKPHVPFVYLSIKPSPVRHKYMPIQKESNRLIQAYLSTQNNTRFVNLWPLQIDKYGMPRKDIVVDDSLHLNEKGYLIWQKALEPYLLKDSKK